MPGGISEEYYTKPKPTPVQTSYSNAATATKQNANDYEGIMNKWKDIYQNVPTGAGSGAADIRNNYVKPTYETTPDYTGAIGRMKNTADRGLYSDEEKGDIRERGISPIRSVYANAQRGVNRQRRLQGGYSPNYAAVSAKMAREMSSQLSDATTRVNAQLAQDVASQRAAGQSQYLSTASHEQDSRNQFGLSAADSANRNNLSAVDASMKDYWMPTQLKSQAAQGMTSTYGTTPAWANTMNNTAQNENRLAQSADQEQNNAKLKKLQLYGGVQ